MNETLAVLDADFLNKINEIRSVNPDELFQKLMRELNCTPVVHPFVMDHELFGCGLAQRMQKQGVLRRVDYTEFLPAEKKEKYEQQFRDLYRMLTSLEHERAMEADEDIFARHAGKSYGEIHSVLMANQMGIPVFYSNDHSGKSLCRRFRHVDSKTMEDIHRELTARGDCTITTKEWKYLLHST